MGVHTDPDDVPEELGEMENAYNWAVSQGKCYLFKPLDEKSLSDHWVLINNY